MVETRPAAGARRDFGGLLRRWESAARTLGATTAIGILLGVLIGGVGGRLAMRLLFLTSEDGVRGVISDDGFEIGRFSSDTVNLLVSGAFLGIVGAFVYLAVRPSLIGPAWLRTLTCAGAAGAVLGGLIVEPDGVDFTRLSPLWLAVVLFVAIPAVFAALAAPAIEGALRDDGWARSASLPVVLGPLVVFLFPPLFIVVALPALLVLGARSYIERSPSAGAIAHRPSTRWALRGLWGAVALFGVFVLGEDIYRLASR